MDIFPVASHIADATEILALQKLAYLSEAELYDDFTIQPLHQTLEEVEEEYQTKKILKVEMAGKIVGSVRAQQANDTCFIGKLIVDPAFQNQGIGSMLLLAVENLFTEAKRFELFTGNRSTKNLYLYTKNGYQAFKRETLSESVTLTYLEKLRFFP